MIFLLDAQVVHVFWLKDMNNLEFVIDKLTLFKSLQAMISKKTGIPLERQIVTNSQLVSDNELTDAEANVWLMNVSAKTLHFLLKSIFH